MPKKSRRTNLEDLRHLCGIQESASVSAERSVGIDSASSALQLPTCPYRIQRFEFPIEWEAISRAKCDEFFRYESWLRASDVWTYARKAQNKYPLDHVIGGISVAVLPWLLVGGHHDLIRPQNNSLVRDLAGEITTFMKGSIGQTLARSKLSVVLEQIIELAKERRDERPTGSLFLHIDLSDGAKSIMREVAELVKIRRQHRAPQSLIAAELKAEAAACPAAGHPADFAAWVRRLTVWDLRKQIPHKTFDAIGKECWKGYAEGEDKDTRDTRMKLAHKDYQAALAMIKAAATGDWPP